MSDFAMSGMVLVSRNWDLALALWTGRFEPLFCHENMFISACVHLCNQADNQEQSKTNSWSTQHSYRSKKRQGQWHGKLSVYNMLSWCLLNPINAKPCQAVQEHPSRTVVSINYFILHECLVTLSVCFLIFLIPFVPRVLGKGDSHRLQMSAGMQVCCIACSLPLAGNRQICTFREDQPHHLQNCGAARLGLK